ncbi:ankyrin repeat-containing domain protein [Bisporella sp. PMI_857]|nr:ankyrin repeat-containing domain protein [Bisporella sp. PMI_857]
MSGDKSPSVDINNDDPVGLTPLIKELRNKDKVKELLENGADVNFPALKRVPLRVAKSRHGTPICRYPIEFAAANATLEIFKLLLDHGASLENTNTLHAAAGGVTDNPEEQVKIIEYLLSQGQDINRLEFAGDENFATEHGSRFYGTPLHYAAAWGNEERFECLLSHGADSSILGYNYTTKKHWGTALEWQEINEEDEGCYSARIRGLLSNKKQA